MFSHQCDVAVLELVLCENVAQKLDFSAVVSVKLLKYENIHAQNTHFCQENNKLVSCMLAFSPSVTWY